MKQSPNQSPGPVMSCVAIKQGTSSRDQQFFLMTYWLVGMTSILAKSMKRAQLSAIVLLLRRYTLDRRVRHIHTHARCGRKLQCDVRKQLVVEGCARLFNVAPHCGHVPAHSRCRDKIDDRTAAARLHVRMTQLHQSQSGQRAAGKAAHERFVFDRQERP